MEEKIDLYRDLEIERLLLRKITVDDAEELYKKVYSNVDSIALVEAVGMSYEYTRKDGYKLDDDYYDQRVYTLIKKEEKKSFNDG